MKYTILLFVGILFCVSCQNEVTEDAKQESREILEAARADSKVKMYNGTITGKRDIEVQLVTDKSKVQGFYLDNKEKLILPIKGVKREDGTVELSAYDETGGTVELFIGTFDDTTLSGKWYNKQEGANGETATFSMEENTDFPPQEDLIDLKGTYEYSVQGYTSYIIIEPIGNKTVKLQAMITYRSCTGEAKGEAYIYNNQFIVFYGEDNCFLKLEIGDKKITANEISCSYYHGFGCIFDGEYRKVNSEVKWIMDS